MYIQEGGVKFSVVSPGGKEKIVRLVGPGDFRGDRCLPGLPFRMGTATAIKPTTVLVIEKKEMVGTFHGKHKHSDCFIAYLLTRNIRVEEDLLDQLLNSTEKRLARGLLLLARYGKQNQPQMMLSKITEEALAKMVDTTRSRIKYMLE